MLYAACAAWPVSDLYWSPFQAENEALRQQLRKSESLRRKSHRALLELQQVGAAEVHSRMRAKEEQGCRMQLCRRSCRLLQLDGPVWWREA